MSQTGIFDFSYKIWNTVIVVDQEVLDLDIQTDVYDITFGDIVKFPVTMRWGSRVNLTWYVLIIQ